eukprot:snap_masked-scaffold_4-processed-gene-2.10-mRNA-1 protein AED:1.00 eAED:1.00 QI:0/-1/0/0/-1/1/1/0/63
MSCCGSIVMPVGPNEKYVTHLMEFSLLNNSHFLLRLQKKDNKKESIPDKKAEQNIYLDLLTFF